MKNRKDEEMDELIKRKIEENPQITNLVLRAHLLSMGLKISLEDPAQKRSRLEISLARAHKVDEALAEKPERKTGRMFVWAIIILYLCSFCVFPIIYDRCWSIFPIMWAILLFTEVFFVVFLALRWITQARPRVEIKPRKALELFIIAGLSMLFAIALFFVTLETTGVVNNLLLKVFPKINIIEDLGRIKAGEIIEFWRPVGYLAFATVIVLILVGFLCKKGYLSVLGSLALYLPVFGYFAYAMFFLAGVGAIRVLWLPLIDIHRGLLGWGNIVYIPYFILAGFLLPYELAGLLDINLYQRGLLDINKLITSSIMISGTFIFFVGTMTWLYGKFKGLKIVDLGIYRYSRHPQYFGYLLWSYGLLLSASLAPVPCGGLYTPPSLPWLILALTIIGLALHEENKMNKKYGEEYKKYRDQAPFMLPLPKPVSKLITASMRTFLKKDSPENMKEIVKTIAIYALVLILLSIALSPILLC